MKHETINYLEFATTDIRETQTFFETVFGFSFQAWGDDYIDFADEQINGGFFSADQVVRANEGAPLIVFYSNNLTETQNKILKAGGSLSKPIFSFPGGKRFHFIEPGGNEMAVWSDKD